MVEPDTHAAVAASPQRRGRRGPHLETPEELHVHVVLVGLSLSWPCSIATRARHEVEALVGAGHLVTVVTDAGSSQEALVHDLVGAGAHVELVPTFVTGKKGLWFVSREIGFAVSAHKRLRAVLRRGPVDLVVAHSSGVCIGLPTLAGRAGVAATHVIHGLAEERRRADASPYNWQTSLFYVLSDRWAARFMPSHLPVSEFMLDEMVAVGARRERCHVSYNPVEVERFQPDPSATKDVDVLYVGRLAVEKGVDGLIAALALLPELEVVIAGEGPLREGLEAQAGTLPRPPRFVGRIPHDELPALVNRARVQAVPSPSEPFGMVVVEAMACGTPVVACGVGGIPEILAGGRGGWLVPPRDAQ
ncbi:MAG TPA: glycosyltransferase family 4 protein, partial [Actinomycetales bacterium]